MYIKLLVYLLNRYICKWQEKAQILAMKCKCFGRLVFLLVYG